MIITSINCFLESIIITSATLVRVPDHEIRTVTRRYSRGVTHGAEATRIRLALVGLRHAAPNGIRTLDVSR